MMRAPSDDESLDIPAFRARIRKMSDAHLLRCGRAAAYMASPAAHYGPVRVRDYDSVCSNRCAALDL
jgi:hypothetical protein